MSASSLGSRAIMGMLYAELEQALGSAPINALAMRVDSDQASEEHRWLGMAPAMREWIGGRQAKGLRDNGFTIANKKWEATLGIPVDWIRRDKTRQIEIRIADLAERAAAHPYKLMSELLVAAESSVCYDGQFFFDTDHAEGDSGTQSNDLSIDISALPVTNNGSITAPSVGEMREVILQCVQQIIGFKDDQGEPMNELARAFAVVVPTTLMNVAQAAVSLPMVDSGESNIIPGNPNFSIQVLPNARVNASWASKVAVFRTDSRAKPFVHQVEEDVTVRALAEGSEHEFVHDEHQYGVKKIENVGYGFWQYACLATMV